MWFLAMNKRLKTLCCIIAALSFGITANAAWRQSGEDEITIDLGENYSGSMVTIDVFAEGKTAEDLLEADPGEYLNIIVHRHQGVLNSEGTYSFRNGGNSGRYNAYITVEGMSEYLTEEIDFVNITQFKSAIAKVNEILAKEKPSYSEIAEIIDKNAASFGLAYEEYEKFDSIDGSKMVKILAAMTENGELDSDNRDLVLDMVKKSIFVQMLNEEKISDIFADLTLSELDKSELSDWYNKEFVKNDFKADMTKRLSGQDFESYDEYKDALVEAYVLATVKHPNGYKNIKEVVKEFEEEIGLEYSSGVSDTVWSELAGENFDDFEELCDEYDDLTSKKSSGGSSSGGGSGSSSKYPSKTTTQVSMPAAPEPITPTNASFLDVQTEHWAYEAIAKLAADGVVNGRGDNRFEPDSLITREEFVKLIVSCVDTSDTGADITFSDVNSNAWYYEFVKKAYNSGIVTGYSDEFFGIGDLITRQDMATIVYRVVKMNGGANVSNADSFADDANIADYAREGIYALREMGIISGTPDNEFQPNQPTTRAQAAMVIYNLLSE